MIKKERCIICSKKLVNGFCSECGVQQSSFTDSTKSVEGVKPQKSGKTLMVVCGFVCIILILLPLLLNTPLFQSLADNVQQVITSEAVYEKVSRLPPIEKIDTPNWDIGTKTDISYSFHPLSSELILTGWNTSSVTDMSHLFDNASNITDISHSLNTDN